MAEHKNNIVFFDGVCNLCNTSVQQIIKLDPTAKLKFASLQSEAGQKFLIENNKDNSDFESIIFLRNDGKYFEKSSAIAEIGKELGGYKSFLARLMLVVPQVVRDYVYSLISKNRYIWFGKKETCWIPTPDLKNRFLN